MTTPVNSPSAPGRPTIDPACAALLVIDMQRYFVRPDCALGRLLGQTDPAETQRYLGQVRDRVIPNIRRLLDAFRAAGSTVAFTEFGSHSNDGRDMPLWARRHNDLGREVVAAEGAPEPVAEAAPVDMARLPAADEALAVRPETLVVHASPPAPPRGSGARRR